MLLSSGAVAYADDTAEKHHYRARVSLTERGRAIVEAMRAYSVSAVKAASADVAPEDIALFYRVLRTINQNLKGHTALADGEGEKA